jgi:hypothetical protein
MTIEEDEKDIVISFALDDDNGDIRSLILHRTLFYEHIMPEEERGTMVSLEREYLEEEHLNTLEYIEFDKPVLRIKARLRSYEVDAHRLEPEELEELKKTLAHQNYDNRFKIEFT